MPEIRSWVLIRQSVGRSWRLGHRICYRLIAALARLAVRSGRSKDLEIIVLRVGAEYCVVAGQAAFRYSLMRPWHRVDLMTRSWAGSALDEGAGGSGGCWSSERWGRWVL